MSEFSGNVAAIDVYCWLHKGASLFAEDVEIRSEMNGKLNWFIDDS